MFDPKRPIWLTGMMGVGKSTVGQALAQALDVPFLDTDHTIESQAGRTIAEIFAEEGEAAFRQREADVIEQFSQLAGVVPLGGGALIREGTAARLMAAGPLVYLRARPETLLARIGDPSSRPLLAKLGRKARLQKLRALLNEREASYASANIIVDTDGLARSEVVKTIVAQLG